MLGPVELVDEVDSTNRVLLDRARDGAPHGLVLVADHQTAGRGRLGRTWEAEPGAALLVSVLLRPSLPPDRVHLLNLAAALAARDACTEIAGVTPLLKWPNDLVIDRAGASLKLAGLLAEAVTVGTSVEAVVLGMGLNLRAGSLPPGAIALDEIADRVVSRGALLDGWLRALDRRIAPFDATTTVDEYRSACATVGRRVSVGTAVRAFQGDAAGVGDNGELIVMTDDGVQTVTVGDVVHVRPTV